VSVLKKGAKTVFVERDLLAAGKPALRAQMGGKVTKHRGTKVLILGASVLVQVEDEETGKQIAYLVTDAEVEIE
jgi:hypothetical protein